MSGRAAPRFSIAIIARNEATALPRLLADLAPFRERGGEILLLDTGSADETVAIARRAGGRVIEAPRRFRSVLAAEEAAAIDLRFAREDEAPLVDAGADLFHFGNARQYANELAESDFVLQLDASDQLPAFDIDALEDRIGAREVDSFEYDQHYGDVVLRIARFFDRRCFQWRGRVHEVPTRTAVAPANAFRCDASQLLVRHHRSEKTRQYLPGLALQALEAEGEPRWWHYVGRELYYQRCLHSAIATLETHAAMENAWLPERAQSLSYIGECRELLEQGHAAEESYRRAAALDPSRREPLIRLASLLSRRGDFAASIPPAEQALAIPRTCGYGELAANYTWVPHSLLYWSYFWLGKKSEARAHWDEFVRLAPDHELVAEHGRMFSD